MTATLKDVIVINFVLVGIELLSTQEQVRAFVDAVEPDVKVEPNRTTNLLSGETEQGKTVAIDRERIAIESFPSRTSISRQYPSRSDLHRFSEVISEALNHTELGERAPRAFGYNMDMVLEQDSGRSALSYLGERILGSEPPGNPDWDFAGATCRAIFSDDSRLWTFNVEPRFNDPNVALVFMSVNLHVSEQRFPSGEEIATSLNSIWEESQHFQDSLDQRNSP